MEEEMLTAKRPKVSICIPTYGRAHILQNVIQSVFNQTYKDFEVFISDDASPDDTEDVVKSFHDSRIRYHKNTSNLGLRDNWSFTIEHAVGEYVFKLDDDDYIAPTFIEKTVDLLEKYPNVGSVYTGFFYAKDYHGGWTNQIVDSVTFERDYIKGIDFIKSYLLRTSIPGLHLSSVVFRYNLAKEIGFYQKVKNDISFSLALASKADVGYIREALFYYVQHDFLKASYDEKNKMEQFYHFDPTRIINDFFELDFIKSNDEVVKIKDEVVTRERKIRSVLHLFMSRKAFGIKEHAKITFALIKKDKKLLMSPLFMAGLIVTFVIPKTLAKKVTYMYKSKSIFRKLCQIIFRSPSQESNSSK